MHQINDFRFILQELMLKKGLTQADLCRMTEIPTSLMSNYLTGKKSPALSNAQLIAEALGVSLDVLSGKEKLFNKKDSIDITKIPTTEKEKLIVKINKLNEKGCLRVSGFVDSVLMENEYKCEFAEDFIRNA